MIITIAGKPGAGKTTVGKMLAKKYDMEFLSTGNLRGQMAMEKGITIDELNEIGEKEDWTDKEVDDKIKKMGEEKDQFIIDSWLAWHFIPKSVKIYLDVDPRVGAERVFQEQREDEEKKDNPDELMDMLLNRLKHSAMRYKKYYGVDIFDLSHFDLIIDTSGMPAEEVAEKIEEFVKDFF